MLLRFPDPRAPHFRKHHLQVLPLRYVYDNIDQSEACEFLMYKFPTVLAKFSSGCHDTGARLSSRGRSTNVVTRFSRTFDFNVVTSQPFQPIVDVIGQRCQIMHSSFERQFHCFLLFVLLILVTRSICFLFLTLSTGLYSMARNSPDKETRRRVEETSGMRKTNRKTPQRSSLTSNGGDLNLSRRPPLASSSSASTNDSSTKTTPQPLQSTAESINSQLSASTPIVPTRNKFARRSSARGNS